MNDWNPEQYLKFRKERNQPSIDLVNRIPLGDPKFIIDFGCGPGNSTQVLVNRWPNANVVGLDNSSAMIEKAKTDFLRQEWIHADASTYHTSSKFDIVFSNAAIQWIPDHHSLLRKFYGLLNEGGALAVQIPLFFEMPLGKIIWNTGQDSRWIQKTAIVPEQFTIHDYSYYYDQLSSLFKTVSIWITVYMDILDSHDAMLEMMRSTGMKPYLEKLDTEDEKQEFEQEVLKGIIESYPLQKNNKVLLPFKRLFFLALK